MPVNARSIASLSLAIVVAAAATGAGPRAESGALSTTAGDAPASDPASAAALLKQQAAQLVATLHEYRASLDRLLAVHERALAAATERQAARWELYRRDVLSRRELEESAAAVAAAQKSVDETRRAMEAADQATAEAAALEQLAEMPPPATGEHQQTALVSRYKGPGVWSLASDTPKLQQFFADRFGHALPVSAYGQTSLHDRMGFDHKNALDVAVHPDSTEGKALIDHLRAAGIPFIAYRGAVSGSASGAHIHVGQPSPRIAVRR
jgi:hypothetical protein